MTWKHKSITTEGTERKTEKQKELTTKYTKGTKKGKGKVNIKTT